jgi:Cdc6-like AAA superfamily ATPase
MSEPIDYNQISLEVAQVFTPNTPVSEKDMFSGRIDQIRKIVDVIFQKGQHAIIFGDRGVGKTSLANVLAKIIPAPKTENELVCVRINCDTLDTFGSVWKKALGEMKLIATKEGIGFTPEILESSFLPETLLPDNNISPDDVRKALLTISNSLLPIMIIDEFDRLPENVKRLFADLIKSISDHALATTVILIGVGDSVEQLIKEHESVSRALVQINMPRMTQDEIREIIKNSLSKINMTIEPQALNNISSLSKGLPHYAHLIGKHCAREALNESSLVIKDDHFKKATTKAINEAQHSIRTAYHAAIRSTKKVNLFSDVILACSLVQVNELGEFAAQDVRAPMRLITGRSYEIAAFARHLDEFSSVTRGNILIKTGARKRFRYRFKDPLMQSFVIMQGIQSGKISSPSI